MTPKELHIDTYLKTETGMDSKEIINHEVILKKDLVALINLSFENHLIMSNYPLKIIKGAKLKIRGFTDMQRGYALIEAIDSPFEIKDMKVVLKRLIEAIK